MRRAGVVYIPSKTKERVLNIWTNDEVVYAVNDGVV